MSLFSDFKRTADRIDKLAEQKDITWLQLVKGCAKAVKEEIGQQSFGEDTQEENTHECRK